MLDKNYIEHILNSENKVLESIGLKVKSGVYNRNKRKKYDEIVGFCEHLFKTIFNMVGKNEFVFLECSCGKSYLSFVINSILSSFSENLNHFFYGIDKNRIVIEKCVKIKSVLGYSNMEFIEGNTINYTPPRHVDAVLALHACDTATDEAIAKGIEIGAKFIIVVPCCQNQIRPQLKFGHPLTALTDFGLLRYRFANILTEALRSQFLRGNGYSVELKEIVSTKTTPKNLIIIARKKSKRKEHSLKSYNSLIKTFNIQPKL